MALRTALGWSSVQSALRLVLSFISIKVTAVYLGAAGLALVGQVSNFVSLSHGLVGNALQTGVTTMTAEHPDDPNLHARLWSTALKMALFFSGVVALLIMALAVPLSSWLLGTRAYWPVMALAGPAIMLVAVSLILSGILNGQKNIRALSLSAIGANVVGAALFIPLVYAFGIWGGLIGTVLSSAGSLCVVSWVFIRARVARLTTLWQPWDATIARKLMRYFPMLLAHSVAPTLALLMVRTTVITHLGLPAAGLWQAVSRVSDMYTLVLMTALSLYLMSHLSSIRATHHFTRELIKVTLQVVALTAVGATGIYLLRDWVVALVFTHAFAPVRDLFGYQFLGDVFLMAGWPLRMALVIKLRTRWYIALELGAPLLRVGLTRVLLGVAGLQAATLGYMLAYLLVDLLLLVALRDYLGPYIATMKGNPQ